ncbi:MAG: hypothetical protein QG635_863 [Bacteroidota bacterium]|nr:hypothetical protein [Bacteroidota bacterium]
MILKIDFQINSDLFIGRIMKTILNWRKGIFKNIFTIYSGVTQVGYLKESFSGQSASCELNGVKYHFKTKGFFNPHTLIFDENNNNEIGIIDYNSWLSKAIINIRGVEYLWKYDNMWNTQSSITGGNGTKIEYKGNGQKGSMEFEDANDLLAMSGLFISNYYWQIMIVFISVAVVFISVTAGNILKHQ